MNELSQQQTVRTLRILYPIWFLFGIFSLIYVPSHIIDLNDAIKTAHNIAENPVLFRLGIAGSLVTQLLFIFIPFYLYQLFKNIDKNNASLMLILALVSVPITMYNETNKLIVLDFLDNPNKVMELLDIFNMGMGISTIFWGLWLFPLGILVYKSGLFPRVIGLFLFIGGISYLFGSFIKIISPEFKRLDIILEPMALGEVLFIFWFVVKGVSNKKTNEQQRL
jgi:hypothetical protein